MCLTTILQSSMARGRIPIIRLMTLDGLDTFPDHSLAPASHSARLGTGELGIRRKFLGRRLQLEQQQYQHQQAARIRSPEITGSTIRRIVTASDTTIRASSNVSATATARPACRIEWISADAMEIR